MPPRSCRWFWSGRIHFEARGDWVIIRKAGAVPDSGAKLEPAGLGWLSIGTETCDEAVTAHWIHRVDKILSGTGTRKSGVQL